MAYRVNLKQSAEKELERLQANIRIRIVKRLLDLEQNPRPSGIKRLQGEESYRLRVGDYRVLYTVDDRAKVILILAVGHRREVYR
jgi:mRNA interferase RelE/StbE